ncbi:site-specific integrase [Skermanella sp. TT6]|uniref:Site-specific integrase n=1 Tax=Skermanella cutis TaxID=2775420 RepID=A0ABX7B620_9PROT|nr:site-specific integrase [Skermanella sp. TT6]QQP89819.1 site-specific integrase [Skermanella sp. TT6]
MRTRITKRIVDAARAEGGRRLHVYDDVVQGFGLRVTPAGAKSYFVEYRPGTGGRNAPKRRMTIGTHGAPWTPDTARNEAVRILGLVRAGKDPAADRQRDRQVETLTVATLAERYIAQHCKIRQRSWRERERVFNRDVLPLIGRKPADQVSRADIEAVLDSIGPQAPTMRRRTFAYLRAFWNWAVRKEHVATSPCDRIDGEREAAPRERVLTEPELVEIWTAAGTIGYPWGPFIKLLILTAQRRSEVAGMTWAEVHDTDDGPIWRIPGGRAKNGKPHAVPLSPQAMALLADIPRQGQLVFTTTGKTPISGFSKGKARLDRLIQAARGDGVEPMTEWTLHDLRRTTTTGLARLGVRAEVADKILNHLTGTIKGVAAVYQRHDYVREARAALELWGWHLERLTGLKL